MPAGASAVTVALAGLAAEHREALAATYFRRRTVNEAAALMGLPVETLKERVYAALQALQRAVS